MSAFFRVLIGGVFGALCALVLSPALAAFVTPESRVVAAAPWLIILASAALGFFAANIRRAFGRAFLLLGLCFVALPLSAGMLSGRVATEMTTAADAQDQLATAAGAGLASVAVVGVSAFIGIILGTICLVIGLVLTLGGRREVVVVQTTESRRN
jgi:hypothetical protein